MASNVLTAESPASTYAQLLHIGVGTAGVAVVRTGLGVTTALSFVSGGAKITGTFEVTGDATLGGALNLTGGANIGGAINASGTISTGAGANKTTLTSSATVPRAITFPDANGVVMLQGSPITLPRTVISLATRKMKTDVLQSNGIITEMGFTPLPNSVYTFEAYFIYQSTSTTCGISLNLNFGGYPVCAGAAAVADPAGTVVYVGADASPGGNEWLNLVATVGVPLANTVYFIRASGFYKTSAAVQVPVNVAFNPEINGTQVSLEIGSMIIHDKIS